MQAAAAATALTMTATASITTELNQNIANNMRCSTSSGVTAHVANAAMELAFAEQNRLDHSHSCRLGNGGGGGGGGGCGCGPGDGALERHAVRWAAGGSAAGALWHWGDLARGTWGALGCIGAGAGVLASWVLGGSAASGAGAASTDAPPPPPSLTCLLIYLPTYVRTYLILHLLAYLQYVRHCKQQYNHHAMSNDQL